MNRFGDRVFEFITETERRYWAALFFFGLFAYTLLLVREARTYGSAPRLFPLIVGVPLLGMLLFKLLQLLGGERFSINVRGVFEDMGNMDVVKTDKDLDPITQYRNEFMMIVWTVAVTVLIYAFGLLTALGIFVFAFVYVYERSLLRAVVVTVVTYGFVYFLFIELLDAALWRGRYSIEFGGIL